MIFEVCSTSGLNSTSVIMKVLFHSKHFIKTLILLTSFGLVLSCGHRNKQEVMDESDFIFETENIKGDPADYSRPVVITGHISNRDVYPKTSEINIVFPFYDRVSQSQSSVISNDAFAFSFVPYSPRTISMPPFIETMMVCPGDSIHVELDFADLGKVVYSGRGAENNEKLNDFHMGYYLSKDWPGFSNMQEDSEGKLVRVYKNAEEFSEAAKQSLAHHLSRLDDFISEKQPSKELAILCRKEIEVDYYSALIGSLLLYGQNGQDDVTSYFRIQDAEHLFSEDYMNSNLFELSSRIRGWSLNALNREEIVRLYADYPSLVQFLKKTTKNDILRQMMITDAYNQLLEANNVERFEEYFASFNDNVTFPLLKLSTRDRYMLKKEYSQNPRILSDAILKADKPRDGKDVVIKENEGLKLLREIITKENGKVVYITIGAKWCPGSLNNIPYQQSLAADYQGKPLRIVNFYLDNKPDDVNSIALGIENFHLTDAQRLGFDPILHLGRGIPFFILIDKDGVIVDFGNHLRASNPATREKIDEYIDK